jgi:hypothetical protein
MTILKQILDEIKTDDKTEKLRQLCDKIQIEETGGKEDKIAPKGPNILLSLEVPGRTVKDIAFLTLERESNSKYLVILQTMLKSQLVNEDASLKRRKFWEIEDNRPEKILTFYAEKLKYLKGE